MEFLKEVLGQNFDEFAKIVGDYNEKNPEKPVMLVDLSAGGYVAEDKFNELMQKYENDTKTLSENLKKAQFDYLIETALADFKPKNTKAVKALIDFDKITFEDGVVSGLTEQIEMLKKEESYLFESGTVPQFSRPVGGADEEMTRDDFKKLSYMEKLKLKKEAPKIFSKLK